MKRRSACLPSWERPPYSAWSRLIQRTAEPVAVQPKRGTRQCGPPAHQSKKTGQQKASRVNGGLWGTVGKSSMGSRGRGGAEVLGNPRVGRNDIDVCDRDVVMNVLLHLYHDPINFGKIGHICFYPLLLRVGRRGKGGSYGGAPVRGP